MEKDIEAGGSRAPATYRVSGDIEVRSKELEQELLETRARAATLERQLWGARRSARANKALAQVAVTAGRAGGGAVAASLAGLALHALDIVTSASTLLGLVVFGWVIGILFGLRRKEGERDDFPEAPPPRLE